MLMMMMMMMMGGSIISNFKIYLGPLIGVNFNPIGFMDANDSHLGYMDIKTHKRMFCN
jgi:hypothetical protein